MACKTSRETEGVRSSVLYTVIPLPNENFACSYAITTVSVLMETLTRSSNHINITRVKVNFCYRRQQRYREVFGRCFKIKNYRIKEK